MKHLDGCTHIDIEEDYHYLRTEFLDVNMRLFKSNPRYKEIILACTQLAKDWTATKKEGYKKPHGVSGANLGIPWNIIAIMRDGEPVAMINPTIIATSRSYVVGLSNCGSLTLKHPINIQRYEWISFSYFNEDGEKIVEEMVDRTKGGLTIQHEIEHNLGILITDKVRVY